MIIWKLLHLTFQIFYKQYKTILGEYWTGGALTYISQLQYSISLIKVKTCICDIQQNNWFVNWMCYQFLCVTLIDPNIAKLSSSSIPVQSNLNWDLALNLLITTPTPTHPHPPGKVEIQPLLDYLGHWNLVWKLYSTKLGQLAN